MPEATVTLTFQVRDDRIQELVTAMRESAERLKDGWQCPDVWPGEDIRCELDRDHDGEWHFAGNLSWPNKAEPMTVVAPGKPPEIHVGHVPHPGTSCRAAGRHHHWQSPTGQDWVIPGAESDCSGDEFVRWEAGML